MGSFARRLVEALRAEFQAAGHGAQTRTARAIGVSSSYFSAVFSRGGRSLPVGILDDALDALGIEPPAFLRRLCPRIDDPIAEFKDRANEARQRHGEPPVLTRLRALELVDEPSAATLVGGRQETP